MANNGRVLFPFWEKELILKNNGTSRISELENLLELDRRGQE